MSALVQHISTLNFRSRPVAGHMPECSRAGTDVWEACLSGKRTPGPPRPWLAPCIPRLAPGSAPWHASPSH